MGFPFKLIINYKDRKIVRKICEAEQLLQQIWGKFGNGREGQSTSANTNSSLKVKEVVNHQLKSGWESLVLHHNF